MSSEIQNKSNLLFVLEFFYQHYWIRSAVDYRLTCEACHPAQLLDALAAYAHVTGFWHINPSRFVFIGTCGGGGSFPVNNSTKLIGFFLSTSSLDAHAIPPKGTKPPFAMCNDTLLSRSFYPHYHHTTHFILTDSLFTALGRHG